jgi:hypothetical protein
MAALSAPAEATTGSGFSMGSLKRVLWWPTGEIHRAASHTES